MANPWIRHDAPGWPSCGFRGARDHELRVANMLGPGSTAPARWSRDESWPLPRDRDGDRPASECDLENGYGDAPEAAAEMIRLAAESGVVGGSIEDATGRPGQADL